MGDQITLWIALGFAVIGWVAFHIIFMRYMSAKDDIRELSRQNEKMCWTIEDLEPWEELYPLRQCIHPLSLLNGTVECGICGGEITPDTACGLSIHTLYNREVLTVCGWDCFFEAFRRGINLDCAEEGETDEVCHNE